MVNAARQCPQPVCSAGHGWQREGRCGRLGRVGDRACTTARRLRLSRIVIGRRAGRAVGARVGQRRRQLLDSAHQIPRGLARSARRSDAKPLTVVRAAVMACGRSVDSRRAELGSAFERGSSRGQLAMCVKHGCSERVVWLAGVDVSSQGQQRDFRTADSDPAPLLQIGRIAATVASRNSNGSARAARAASADPTNNSGRSSALARAQPRAVAVIAWSRSLRCGRGRTSWRSSLTRSAWGLHDTIN